ncbi:enhancer of mRNA-decapping protein 4 isoform X2 [Manduca sexta]|uniref:enhancer of mRNA-decapping protein 4 isoform X2 n=1 Tax=Manduca sexta TaxID=7130 RepID=UPI001183383F|nr:enhancer of mRNA-decapping protein 4 isoform X2 [Manduca sexta]
MNIPKKFDNTLKRSKSLCSLQNEQSNFNYAELLARTVSESSIDVCIVNDTSDSDDAADVVDSGIAEKSIYDSDLLVCLEQKIDRLSDMFLEQCRLLTTLKEEICKSKLAMEKTEHVHNQIFTDLLKKAITQSIRELNLPKLPNTTDSDGTNHQAKLLLDAIESNKGTSFGREIREELMSFLQSEELKKQMVNATTESVKDIVGGCLSRDFSNLYLPILERSHRRLVTHVSRVIETAFVEQENSTVLSKSVYKTSRVLRRALERHQTILEAASDPGKSLINTLQCAVEEFLHSELKQWRQKVLDMFCSQLQSEPREAHAMETLDLSPPCDYAPASPPQPADPGHSIIDQLMQSAEIQKLISEGHVNQAFEQALNAADLSLVMAACRAVDPGAVFTSPCTLKQPVLLSLIQQLATDMVHDTQLKCSYLEDAIINLNTTHSDTRVHLPLVVGEVKKHLSKFLSSYPNHVASRRVTLIIMAADNLLK